MAITRESISYAVISTALLSQTLPKDVSKVLGRQPPIKQAVPQIV